MQADEAVALLRIERLQHVAEVGFVQVADEAAERLAVLALGGAQHLIDEVGPERPLLVADGGLRLRIRCCGRVVLHRIPSARLRTV